LQSTISYISIQFGRWQHDCGRSLLSTIALFSTVISYSYVLIFVGVQLVFSDSIPENVGPGEKVYVVVDGVAYLVVNDDGSDIGSAGSQVLSNGSANTQPWSCDQSVSAKRVPLTNGNSEFVTGSVGNTKVPVLSVATEPMYGDSLGSKTGVEATGSGLGNVSRSGDIPAESLSRTVLAENDDEFEHLASEFPDKPATDDSRMEGMLSTKPAPFVDSFLGFIRATESPSIRSVRLNRPPLPKFVVQPRPQLRLVIPSTSNTAPALPSTSNTTSALPSTCNSMSPGPTMLNTTLAVPRSSNTRPVVPSMSSPTPAVPSTSKSMPVVRPMSAVSPRAVRPVSVISPSPVSSPGRNSVTTVIRSVGSGGLADQKPTASVVKSPVMIKKNDSEGKVTTAASAKPSRQPRVPKKCTIVFNFVCLSTTTTTAMTTITITT